MSKMHIKKGVRVKVIAGNDKDKTGVVLRVNRSKGLVVVEGVRMTKKHVKRSQKSPEGKIETKEGTIHISNVCLELPT